MRARSLFTQGWHLVVLVVIFTCLLACQSRGQPTQVREVVDPQSPLVDALLQESDLSGDWSWMDDGSVYHTPITITAEYQGLTERVSYILTGRYISRENYVKIYHGLERHEEQAPPPIEITLDEDIGLIEPQEFFPEFVSVGQFMESGCWVDLEDGYVTCRVVVSYNSIISILSIYALGGVESTAIEEILNQALNAVDGRIKKIDGFP